VVHQDEAGRVRTEAAEDRLPERQKSQLPEQQIERRCEESENERLREQHRIVRDERRCCDDHEQREKRLQTRPIHRRPKSPCGRSSSTSAIATKIATSSAAGKISVISDCTSPTRIPPTTAPAYEPSPPITTTTNEIALRSLPIAGCPPRSGKMSAPAIAASATPTPNTIVNSPCTS